MIDEPYAERTYRAVMEPAGLTCYRVVIGESDLYVCTRGDRSAEAAESLERHREALEAYLSKHFDFGTSFRAVPVDPEAPDIVRAMSDAAHKYGVGPMASVAGAVAQFVGTDMLRVSPEVVVENGGDIFLAGGGLRQVRIFAGAGSPQIDITVKGTQEGIGLCTSSATVGPSVSLGAADAVTVLAGTATEADAAATAIGNRMLSKDDIASGLEMAEQTDGIDGVVIALQGSVGAWGNLQLA